MSLEQIARTATEFKPMFYFLSAVSFVFGSMIGSFLNVCVYRLPRGESVVRPRSHCPKCGKLIAWYDNLPLLSWLLLAAKCRHCKTRIGLIYPTVELITGLLFVFVFWRFGFVLATPIYMALAAALVLVTFVDFTDWTIPNEVTFPGIPLGLVLALAGMFWPQTWPDSGLLVTDVFDALLGVVIGGGSLYALDKISLLLLGKRGMGFGDVKLLAMLGAFLGWKSVLAIIMLSSCIGSVVGVALMLIPQAKLRKTAPFEEGEEPSAGDETAPEEDEEHAGHYLPFGPYLVAAGLIILFFRDDLFQLYLDFIGVSAAAPPVPF